VLSLKKAIKFIQTDYPFSFAFGSAKNREACIQSSQDVYNRLLLHAPGSQVLKFDTIALLAIDGNNYLDRAKAQALIKLFRPTREGELSVYDFVKSVDSAYKELRLLSAAVENSSQIDRASESIFNTLFYVIMTVVVLSRVGFDPMKLFLSLSSVILALAWLIGPASAKVFDGILFILVRRPYSIGKICFQ
jgi:small-conductance mechanosensitive channel